MWWYPATWAPGKDGAGEYVPRGEPCELRGGPLSGRVAHVHDALECLYVGSDRGRLVVQSSAAVPSPPGGGVVLGGYVLDPRSGFGVLAWYELETAQDVNKRQHPNISQLRRPFAPAWRSNKKPPSLGGSGGVLGSGRRRD